VRRFFHQLRAEQRLFWRSREAAIFVFLLPVLLFLLLGSVYSGDVNGHPAADYLLVGMLGYGVANTAFGGLAITLVLRREAGILKRIRSTPMPSAIYLTAVLASTLIVFALQSALLVALGRLLFDAQLPERVGSLLGALLVGAASFAALGLAAAALVRSAEGSSRSSVASTLTTSRSRSAPSRSRSSSPGASQAWWSPPGASVGRRASVRSGARRVPARKP
jgi:ABC-2 type transport system permease protein